MLLRRKTELFVLVAGDLIVMAAALWFTLAVRYAEPISDAVLLAHLPFVLIFPLWILGFFIFNLYGKRTVAHERALPLTLLKAQVWNSVLAALIFYFVRVFNIAPRANLLIDLVFSFVFLLGWRTLVAPTLLRGRPEHVALLGDDAEADELACELSDNPRYTYVVHRIRNATDRENLSVTLRAHAITMLIFHHRNDLEERALQEVGVERLFNIRLFSVAQLYEELFDRVPLSQVNERWFFEQEADEAHLGYELLKRAMDITVAIFLGVLALALMPFVWIAIKLDDGGPIFSIQERIGRGNKIFHALKLRTMNATDKGKWSEQGKDGRITRVGHFLRATRIDELPQFWNVLRGELSLVGPRPDIIALGEELAAEIPYYTVRNMIKPGLSGWAQINQDLPPRSLGETRERLSYDFYYLKHRSFLLDVKIMLRTVKTLLSRSGL